MKIRPLLILSLSTVALAFTACKPKEETAAPAATPPAPAASSAPAAPAAAPAATTPVAPAAAAGPKVFSPTEAKDHVGESGTVKGKVFGVHVTQKGDVFINVGAAYPNAPFTVVCFGGKIPADDLKALDGKTVAFSGKIKDHNGSTEIILDDADQIDSGEPKSDKPKADAAVVDSPTPDAPKADAPAAAAPAADAPAPDAPKADGVK